MKYLIVSADDFGSFKSINRGIIKTFKDGIVTSIQLMPAAREFADALALASIAGIKEVGEHLCLTDATPVTEIGLIPTLVAHNGRLPKGCVRVALGLASKKINLLEIRLELKNQLERIKNSGLRITSLSGHEHVHLLPDILNIFVELAKEYKIPAIRYPRREKLSGFITIKKFYKICVLGYFEKKNSVVLRNSGLFYTDNILGLLDSGNLKEGTLLRLLKSLGQGCAELVAHPGFLSPEVKKESVFNRNCEKELAALTSDRIKQLVSDLNIKLITFEEFCSCSR
jgi:chitin disaccharide deacetylase